MADSGSDTALAIAVTNCKTREEAAREAGISPRTLYRRLNDPEFQSQLTRIRQQVEEQFVGDLSNAACAAIRVLHNLTITGKDDATKLKAANSVLEHYAKLANSLPGGDATGINDGELARKLEIAFYAGKYGYILPTSGTIPPELAANIPSDPRAQATLMQMVEEKLTELQDQKREEANVPESDPRTADIEHCQVA